MAAGGHRGAVTMAKRKHPDGCFLFFSFRRSFLFSAAPARHGAYGSPPGAGPACGAAAPAGASAPPPPRRGRYRSGRPRRPRSAPPPAMRPTFFTSSLRRVFTAAGSFLPGRGATSISIWGNFFSSMLLSHPPVSGRSGPPRISASIIPDGPPLGKYGPSGTAAHTLDCGHDPRN